MNFEWNHENLELFWHWIAERQLAFYRRKVAGAPPPWCSDPVVQCTHFTNVYRELDPGTIWLRRNVLNNPAYEDDEKAFLAMAYRLFGTEEVFEEFGVGEDRKARTLLPTTFRVDAVAQTLQGLMDSGRQAFTPAYMVSNYGDSRPKPVVIAEVLGRAAADWPITWSNLFLADTRRVAFNALTGVYGIGRFVAFQTLVDLCYPRPKDVDPNGLGVLTFSNDGWVAAGPGAQKGLKLLWPDFKLAEDNLAIAALVKMQREPLEKRGMPWLLDTKNQPILIDRSNMQNCLCEFSKYHRLAAGGTGGRKRGFFATEAVRRDAVDPKLPSGTGAAVQLEAFI